MDETQVNIVLVGDTRTGKTHLLKEYCMGMPLARSPSSYVPTVFDQITATCSVDSAVAKHSNVKLCVWDCGGSQCYDQFRPLVYNSVSVFLLCFSLVNEASLWSVIDKWQHELVRHAPNVPVVLVGTHADIRESISPSSASVFSRKAIQKLHQRNLHLTHLPPATIVPEILQKVGAPRDHDVKSLLVKKKGSHYLASLVDLIKSKRPTGSLSKGQRRSNAENDISIWNSIPEEIHLKIFSFLPVEDLCRLSRVNHLWCSISHDHTLWIPHLAGLRVDVERLITTHPQYLGGEPDWKNFYLELLVEQQCSRPILYETGLEVARQIDALCYIEKTDRNTNLVVEQAIRAALGPRRTIKRSRSKKGKKEVSKSFEKIFA